MKKIVYIIKIFFKIDNSNKIFFDVKLSDRSIITDRDDNKSNNFRITKLNKTPTSHRNINHIIENKKKLSIENKQLSIENKKNLSNYSKLNRSRNSDKIIKNVKKISIQESNSDYKRNSLIKRRDELEQFTSDNEKIKVSSKIDKEIPHQLYYNEKYINKWNFNDQFDKKILKPNSLKLYNNFLENDSGSNEHRQVNNYSKK